jgi:hypothetical protein
MVLAIKPRRRFPKIRTRAVWHRRMTAILDATWDQDVEVMLYLADR